ncbi:Conserved_hypothetical protein [Hexamita inflata]|uniref:Uncharacterized protein n=1 Tax=Hexamita inflata TaxID=28002 RepID=A0ABP1ME71_9EUKA
MVRPRRPRDRELRRPLPNVGGPAGILACFPFDAQMAVAERLGPSHPQTVSVAAESFSSSVVCMQIIGYSNQDLDQCALRPLSRESFDARTTTFYLARRASGVQVRGCSAIHFPSVLIRQVSCNTLLRGFRLLWPPSCCLYQPTSFFLMRPCCAPQLHLRLNPPCPSGLPRGAHQQCILHRGGSLRKTRDPDYSKFESWGIPGGHFPPIIISTCRSQITAAILREISNVTSYLEVR